MKNILTLFITILSFICNATAQQLERIQEDDLVLTIIQAQIDGADYSDKYVLNEAFLAFYQREGKHYFANAWQKTGTQSYGEVTAIESGEPSKTEYCISFLWKYANTYDDRKGTAEIILYLKQRPMGIAFELSILTESVSLLIFKGYVNGTLDWKP